MNCVPLIIQQDEFDVQHEFDSLTLRLIRDPLEPTFHTETELQRFRVSYSYIVRCLQTFFSDFFYKYLMWLSVALETIESVDGWSIIQFFWPYFY